MFEGYSGTPPNRTRRSRRRLKWDVGPARRNFWEAAACNHGIGREGLRRINSIFEIDRRFSDLPPSARKRERDVHVRPLVDAFFSSVDTLASAPRERGLSPLRPATPRTTGSRFVGFSTTGASVSTTTAASAPSGDCLRAQSLDVFRQLAPRYWAATSARLDDAEMSQTLGQRAGSSHSSATTAPNSIPFTSTYVSSATPMPTGASRKKSPRLRDTAASPSRMCTAARGRRACATCMGK